MKCLPISYCGRHPPPSPSGCSHGCSRVAGRPGTPARVVTLAVLPCANASGKPDQEYLGDGQTQELIAVLARLHPETLLVKVRASVMRCKKTDKPVDQIGRELGVDYILEGSIATVWTWSSCGATRRPSRRSARGFACSRASWCRSKACG
jgi:hypothetical protein